MLESTLKHLPHRMSIMNTLWVCALLVAAHVQAERIPRRAILRASFGNDTALVNNSTTLSLASTSSRSAQNPTTIATNEDSLSATSKPPPVQSDVPPSRPAPSDDTLVNSSDPTGNGGGVCGDSVMTYFGSVYPTVYLTVTETFDVTLSAANAIMTEKETLITPSSPSACSSTIVPIDNPDQAIATIDVSVTETSTPEDVATTFPAMTAPANKTMSSADDDGVNSIYGDPPSPSNGRMGTPASSPIDASSLPKAALPTPEESNSSEGAEGNHAELVPTVLRSTIYATAPYTSTVIVTKKTPVPVVPRSEEPPVTFQPGSARSSQVTPAGDNPGQEPDLQPGGPNIGDQVNTLVQRPSNDPSGLLEAIIRSIILQPSTSRDIVPQTTLNNVAIAVQPSSVVIGNNAVPIPTGREEAVVTEGGAVFTVRPAEIIAEATTVAFRPLNPQEAISVAPTRITAAPGVVVAVAGSTAIVDGTTFRLDASFSTVVTVSGERISIGPSGIGLASTTIAVGRVTEAPQIVQTVGDVTFTIDGSNVIISGTRYGIGTDSPTITTEFNGERVSIGPGGVGFDSTTISPTNARTSTRSSGDAESTSGGSADENSNSEDGDSSSGGELSAYRLSGSTLLVSLLAFLMAL